MQSIVAVVNTWRAQRSSKGLPQLLIGRISRATCRDVARTLVLLPIAGAAERTKDEPAMCEIGV
jgi:hypothetical protein